MSSNIFVHISGKKLAELCIYVLPAVAEFSILEKRDSIPAIPEEGIYM
jgi:hypothetical protein